MDLNDTCAFNVKVKNTHRNGRTHVSFAKEVYVEAAGSLVALLLNGEIMVSDYICLFQMRAVYNSPRPD